MAKVYCAGPLFNAPEKSEMNSIAAALEQAGFTTFLPQRDGIELASLSGHLREDPRLLGQDVDGLIARSIFALDIAQVASSDAVVVNLNGRVPDEGAVVEAAVAWALNKAVVLYKSDARSLLNGADNPMISGLGDFALVSNVSALPAAVKARLEALGPPGQLSRTVGIGERFPLRSIRIPAEVAELIAAVVQRSAGDLSHEARRTVDPADTRAVFTAARPGAKARH